MIPKLDPCPWQCTVNRVFQSDYLESTSPGDASVYYITSLSIRGALGSTPCSAIASIYSSLLVSRTFNTVYLLGVNRSEELSLIV